MCSTSSDDTRIAELERQVRGLLANMEAARLRFEPLEDRFSTLNTPRWKRLVFRIDGWGPWHTLRTEQGPRWRPWRRWWVS